MQTNNIIYRYCHKAASARRCITLPELEARSKLSV
jgi:hypothetical protein